MKAEVKKLIENREKQEQIIDLINSNDFNYVDVPFKRSKRKVGFRSHVLHQPEVSKSYDANLPFKPNKLDLARIEAERKSAYANAFPAQFYNDEIAEVTLSKKSLQKLKEIKNRRLQQKNTQRRYLNNYRDIKEYYNDIKDKLEPVYEDMQRGNYFNHRGINNSGVDIRLLRNMTKFQDSPVKVEDVR